MPDALASIYSMEEPVPVVASGFPVPETLEGFRSLVAAPLLHGPPWPHPTAHVTRTQYTRPKRPRRR